MIVMHASSGIVFDKQVKTHNVPPIKQEDGNSINKSIDLDKQFIVKDKTEGLNGSSASSDCESDGNSDDEDETIDDETSKTDDQDEDKDPKHVGIHLIKNFPSTDGNEEKKGVKNKRKKILKELSGEMLKKREEEKVAEVRNKHRISIIGKGIPRPAEQFEELVHKYKISSTIIKNLGLSGMKSPTPVQMQAMPVMLEGRQVLACAPTGSGKTAAFLLPILHNLGGPRKRGFRAVIVCPTRELATQTHRECIRLSDGTGLRIIIISKISHVEKKFNPKSSRKFDILITTPNRLVYLLKQDPPMVSLKNVEWLVVDESDKLFEAGVRGFRDQLAVIYNACESPLVKRAMFSATQTPHLTKWCRRNLKDLVSINIGIRNSTVDTVQQELLFVGSEAGKLIAFRDLIRKGVTPPVLVFVQSKERAQELFNELIYDGINVDVIHSDRSQAQRDNVIRSFREGKIWFLICTELMGRGIDFKGVNLVVNYDFPPSSVSYIHRIGRTGRAGRPGKAITYFTQDDTTNLRSIARLLKDSGCQVPDYMLTLKKPNRGDKKKLEKRAPSRDSISTAPIYQKEIDRKLVNAIRRSKRAKKRKLLRVES